MSIFTWLKRAKIALKEMIAHFSFFFAISLLYFTSSRAEGHIPSQVSKEILAGESMAADFSRGR